MNSSDFTTECNKTHTWCQRGKSMTTMCVCVCVCLPACSWANSHTWPQTQVCQVLRRLGLGVRGRRWGGGMQEILAKTFCAHEPRAKTSSGWKVACFRRKPEPWGCRRQRTEIISAAQSEHEIASAGSERKAGLMGGGRRVTVTQFFPACLGVFIFT